MTAMTPRISIALRARTLLFAALLTATSFIVQASPVAVPRPAELTPQQAYALACADGPSFEGWLTSSTSSHPLIDRTTGWVYGYISNVVDDWSCTAWWRYDGLAWARNSDGSLGNFAWGTLISSKTVSCNWAIGSTDYLKANSTSDCPDSDAEYANHIKLTFDDDTTVLDGTYHQDATPDGLGDFMFTHSDCESYYAADVKYGHNFNSTNSANRPGSSNCDPTVLDGTNNTQAIIVDGTAPTSTSVSVNAGATYTASTAITLTLGATDSPAGLSQMAISNDGTNWTTYTYGTSHSWTLTSGDGTKTVYAKFKDANGNWSGVVNDTIVLDTTKPTGSISINAGSTYTASTAVTLNLSASDNLSGVSQMQFSNDNSNWTTYTYGTTHSWTLSGGEGTRTVYARFKDNGGNWSNTYSDAIILDPSPATPNPPNVTCSGTGVYQSATNAACFFRPAAAATLTLTGTATDSLSGVKHIRFQSLSPTTGWTPAPALPNQDTTSPYTEALGFGASAVSAAIDVIAQNGAGVDGSARHMTLTADSSGPTTTFSSPAAGTSVQPSSSVTISWVESDGTGSGVLSRSLQRQKAPETGPSTCGTFANDGSATSAASPVTQTDLLVNACYRWIETLTDRVGNVLASSPSGIVIRDTTANLGMQAQHTFESWDLGAGDGLAVNVANGNLLVTHPIVTLPIRGSSVSIDLTYNSQDPANVSMGPGWRLNVMRRLTLNGDGTVTFVGPDGARYVFTSPVTNGTVTTYTRPANLYATLAKDTSEPVEFSLTYRDQSVDTFGIAGSEGLLTRSEDRFGNGVTLAYVSGTNRITTITDTAASPNRTIDFAYDGSNRLTSITDWVYVSSGVVQTNATGSRRATRFFYDGSSNLIGWADPLNTSGSCPSGGSHLTCLTVTSGLVTRIGKTQTYETLSSGNLGSSTRAMNTDVVYSGSDATTVKDAEQVAGSGSGATFARTGTAEVTVVRPGTPASTTKYTLASANDAYGRVTSVKRLLGTSTWIEQRIAYNATYPIEPASVTENYVDGSPSDTAPDEDRITAYTYVSSSMGLVSRMTEPLTASTHRTTDYTYNANSDVTQEIVALDGSGTTRTVTRYCYDASCSTSGNGLTLLKTIDNYVDGTAGNGAANVEDVTTAYQYDGYGQLTRETRSNYDAAGNLLDSRANGHTYGDRGDVTADIVNYDDGSVTSPGDDITPNATTGARADLTTAYSYDTAGNQVSAADPRRAIESAKGTSLNADDFVSRSTFDPLGQTLTTREPTTPGVADCSPSPGCRTTTSAYDERGAVRESTDSKGVVTATESDRTGDATRTFEDTDGSGGTAAAVTSISTYDAARRVVTAKDRNQAADDSLGYTGTSYDELGRTGEVIEAAGSSPDASSATDTDYDALGRVISKTVGGVQTTTTGYDLGGRTVRTDDEFTCAITAYDYRGLATQTVEGLASGTCTGGTPITTTITNDGLGRVTLRHVDADNEPEANTYDAAGNKLVTSGKQAGTTTSSTFTVNLLDQTMTETRSDGSTTKSNFDAAGNPTDVCYWKPSITVGDCLPADSSSWTNPPTQAATTGYDAHNQRISLVTRLGSTSTVATTIYDPTENYQISAFYLPTGSGKEAQDLYTYDARHRLSSITHQLCVVSSGHACSSTTPTGSSAYSYDDNDNRTTVTESSTGGTATTRTYCYDALNQLIGEKTTTSCDSSPDESYTYDDAGNRLTAMVSGSTRSFAYGSDGQLDSCTSPSCSVSYDDAGRIQTLTDSGTSWTFAYDADGRLTSACSGTTCSGSGFDRVDYLYDGDGHRTQITETTAGGLVTTTDLRYAGDTIVQESVEGTVTRTYATDDTGRIVEVCDPDCASGTIYFVTWNGHGDAAGLWRQNADGTLTLANSYTYSTWGVSTTAVASGFTDLGFRFLYVGDSDVQWDNAFGLGLFYMHARTYSPALGRFLQPDPDGAEANAYVYAGNNPTTFTDPGGTFPIAVAAAAAACASQTWCVGAILAGLTWFTGVTVYGATKAIKWPSICLWNCAASITVSRSWGLAGERAASNLMKGRYPGKYLRFHVYFRTPKSTGATRRYLDVCVYRSLWAFNEDAIACMEVKTGTSRNHTQEKQDAYLQSVWRFPIFYLPLPGVTGRYLGR